MADTSSFTQGIKNPWQRISILFAFAVITCLSSTVAVVYYSKSKADRDTIKYEREQKEHWQQVSQDCETQKYEDALRVTKAKESRIYMQDTTKKILNIK